MSQKNFSNQYSEIYDSQFHLKKCRQLYYYKSIICKYIQIKYNNGYKSIVLVEKGVHVKISITKIFVNLLKEKIAPKKSLSERLLYFYRNEYVEHLFVFNFILICKHKIGKALLQMNEKLHP
ncbi:hypothetical protein RFI_19088 [Reticulomyxa filosa]|uniref:Uncharacterized protein n=1 Tax=Reticulomyxa filosa TaxID=46433 RepID=X6MW16_RETFI|nr:hypothetical protein RFI_19088 [Reticulomyxa filosa]|eukprot:ETO18193.1 hypothetical protein RFI_19088 [Reticulomyxa filosa]